MSDRHKTWVRRVGDKWRVSYYWPYSGVMIVDCDTWDEAMREACNVEKDREMS